MKYLQNFTCLFIEFFLAPRFIKKNYISDNNFCPFFVRNSISQSYFEYIKLLLTFWWHSYFAAHLIFQLYWWTEHKHQIYFIITLKYCGHIGNTSQLQHPVSFIYLLTHTWDKKIFMIWMVVRLPTYHPGLNPQDIN